MNDYLNSLGPLGILQAYRAQPFSLYADMSRPAQFLPQGLPSFDYSAQYRDLQRQLADAKSAQQSPAPIIDYGSPGPGSGSAASGGVGDGGAGGGGGGGGK